MSETTEKNSPACSPFQALEMENRTPHAEMHEQSRASHAEMQAGEVASITKRVRSNKKTAEAESPGFPPKGFKKLIKCRKSGASAGSTDTYYEEESTGYIFRSKPEVESYLRTGKKPKRKSRLLRSVKDEASAAATYELECVKASDGQKQGQHLENQNTSEMRGLHNSGNTEKTPKLVHPETEKALDDGSFTPFTQNDNILPRHDRLVSSGETVFPPDMSPSVSDQAGCHGYLNSHNQPYYPIMSLVNGLLNPGHCSTILGGSLKAVPFSDPPHSPRSVLHHDSDIFHSDLQVQHKPPRGRPRGSKNVGNPREMKRQMAEKGRRLCKQYLEIAKSLRPAKSESDTIS